MKLDKFFFKSVLRSLLFDTLWVAIGGVVSIILAFIYCFSNCLDKATFWAIIALVCIVSTKTKKEI